MRRTILITLLALANLAFAQEGTQGNAQNNQSQMQSDVNTAEGKVTIASRGSDVRPVLFDLFTQSKKNFVLEPNIHFVLYLSLAGVQFAEALEIVCDLTALEYQIDNGIYFIGKKKSGSPQTAGGVAGMTSATTQAQTTAKKGKLTEAEMNKRLTTRYTKIAITDVFKSFTEQTGIQIIVEKDVPLFRIDAYLIDTSLKYALDVIMRSTGLKYTLNDDKQIIVSKK